MKFTLFLIVTILNSIIAEEDNVIILSDSNFQQNIDSKLYLMVLFYAPWCGHCKNFEPDFHKTALSAKALDVYFGKLDATANTEIANLYEINSYPKIKLFIKGKYFDYLEGRNEEEIINWLKLKINPGPKEINLEELTNLIDKKEVIIVYFGNSLSYEFIFYNSAARELAKEYNFYYCEKDECLNHYKAQKNSAVIFKNFEEKRNDFTSLNDLEKFIKFINFHSVPLIMDLNDESINYILEKNYPAMLLVKDINSSQPIDQNYRKICEKNRVSNF